jgi:hypothetical protein
MGLLFSVRKNHSTGGGGAVPLLRAAGFVWNGHFDESGFDERIQDLVPELGPVGSPCQCH